MRSSEYYIKGLPDSGVPIRGQVLFLPVQWLALQVLLFFIFQKQYSAEVVIGYSKRCHWPEDSKHNISGHYFQVRWSFTRETSGAVGSSVVSNNSSGCILLNSFLIYFLAVKWFRNKNFEKCRNKVMLERSESFLLNLYSYIMNSVCSLTVVPYPMKNFSRAGARLSNYMARQHWFPYC